MFNKYRSKNKFISRGVYFITKGEHQGCFAMNIKEYDIDNSKAILLFPDNNTIYIDNDQIAKLLEDDHFEYDKRLPRWVYKICVAEYQYRSTTK